ncbi:hypothetical protein H8K90_10850 [Winogradskyella echinorum]|uniref:Lipocalin-like domain-containing protein n=1 Tax=Winogradskyella echinorum TaxID=538189 RepID=A0ABR6Y2A3_9FLAO|nr:hypothetical protein [Winogradskyella echinorum]MBC3846879.1 hypothetical protein [Winogradskyella echinorum]MBC5751227.1 hypothetical protein [Winogradskyella echinorum]
MKSKVLILSMVFLFVFSCKDKPKSDIEVTDSETELEVNNGLKGTWELTGFYNYKDNVVVDSFSNNTISRQIKMYTDTKVMWCKLLKTDSIEFFGYGTYKYADGNLAEILEFGSAFMNEVIKEKQQFNFQLNLTADRFEQIELDDDGNKVYSENYKRIE